MSCSNHKKNKNNDILLEGNAYIQNFCVILHKNTVCFYEIKSHKRSSGRERNLADMACQEVG